MFLDEDYSDLEDSGYAETSLGSNTAGQEEDWVDNICSGWDK